jgi:acetylornithine deacetylase
MEGARPKGTVDSAIKILRTLIAFPSVSAQTNSEVTDWCQHTLQRLGFSVYRTEYDDRAGVRKANLVAVRRPPAWHTTHTSDQSGMLGGLAYFCHTDVVPAKRWVGPNISRPSDPFAAAIHGDRVYGRGACDMKGSLASMLSAVAKVDAGDQTAPIWIVCTADEEVGFEGAKHLTRECPAYRDLVQTQPLAIIGEPTELDVVYAHKGIRGFQIESRGRAAHSATTDGINANEAMVPMLAKLLELCERTRNEASFQDPRFDPPLLSWTFGVSDHSDVVNITPERSRAWVSLRPMPGITGETLVGEAERLAKELGLTFRRMDGCDPLWTDPADEAVAALQSISGGKAKTVCYATDGGVLTELKRRIVLGPGNIQQAHTADEWISVQQLEDGIDVYEKAVRRWCC